MTTGMDNDPSDWPIEREQQCHCSLREYAVFMDNASRWLHMAARGEVPSNPQDKE
jgi:hypothetical protein